MPEQMAGIIDVPTPSDEELYNLLTTLHTAGITFEELQRLVKLIGHVKYGEVRIERYANVITTVKITSTKLFNPPKKIRQRAQQEAQYSIDQPTE